MTAEVPTAAAGGWLTRLDPGHVALERAARVTIAACLAFYPLRYGLDDPISALYAVFTVISLGALSDVQGAPATRTRSYLGALAAGAVLVTAGTLAAINTAVAVAGMLLVGFTVAYSGVGGPRLVGVANGLQLFYILPCFPPYAPDTLDQRLLGLVIGGGLIVAADRLLWPPPGPPPPGDRLAVAADRIAAFAYSLAGDAARSDRSVRARAGRAPGRPRRRRPPAVGRDPAARAAARSRRPGPQAARRLRGDPDDRGPDRRARRPARRARPHGPPRTADLLGVTAEVFAELAAAVRAGGSESGPAASISTSGLDAALRRYRDDRARHFADHPHPASDLRAGLAAEAVVEDSRIAVLGAGGFLGAPPPDPAATPPALWFLHVSRGELVWRRLRAHLTPRSVYLQNAVRLAARPRRRPGRRRRAGPLARLLGAAGDAQPDADLGLGRQGRAAARPFARRDDRRACGRRAARRGRLHTEVYAWALPPLMVLGFAAGQLFGRAAGQAGFTVVIAVLFAQIAPRNVASGRGTVRRRPRRRADRGAHRGGGMAARRGGRGPPGGGRGAARRCGDGARHHRSAGRHGRPRRRRHPAEPVSVGGPVRARLHAVPHRAAGPAGRDWLVVLVVCSASTTTPRSCGPGGPAGPLPAPDAAADLDAAANEVAAGLAAAAEAISAGDRRRPGRAPGCGNGSTTAAGPPSARRVRRRCGWWRAGGGCRTWWPTRPPGAGDDGSNGTPSVAELGGMKLVNLGIDRLRATVVPGACRPCWSWI